MINIKPWPTNKFWGRLLNAIFLEYIAADRLAELHNADKVEAGLKGGRNG